MAHHPASNRRDRLGRIAPALAMLGLLAATATSARAELIYASTANNRLITFDSATPGTLMSNVAITGVGGNTISGIDFRPLNGILYGLGDLGALFTIDKVSGAATQVGSNITLSGTQFGTDFNPTNNLLRIITNTGTNLSVDPTTAVATTQTPISYAGSTGLSGNPLTSSAAYSNNVPGATSTTLFIIDRNGGTRLLSTAAPAGGVYANPSGTNTQAPLGVTVTGINGFDISGSTGVAYLADGGSANAFYTVNLTTGAATSLGAINATAGQVTGISANLVTTPEPSAIALVGVGIASLAGWRRLRGRRGA